MRPHRETFNDGMMQYGYTKTTRSESGKDMGKVFSPEGKLAFKELSCRDRDYELAGALDSRLDRKIKTLSPPLFRKQSNSNLKVAIESVEYDVIEVDSDPSRRYLFFYLQRVGVKHE
ncbi:head-tail adaptor protein [Rossellomorea sp. DUT-2]|uniref:head-tail adaptor protein n=1 Tax=Rossellomorea sp. DUT-2 TaxID=3412021 RepID=UPI003D17A30B